MRLWHEALIPYLPRQQLLGQHRECCALRGNGWGKKHATVNYVFDHPYAWLVAYHFVVMLEMEKRGYKPSHIWYDLGYKGKKAARLTDDEYDVFESDFDNIFKAATRDYAGDPIYPEHNAAYLQECLDNLKGKGIIIDMEAEK